MLSMEEKKSFINKIRELNDDEKVVKDWVWEENARIRYNNDMAAAEEQGLEQGIEKGIEKGIEQGIEKGIEQGIEQKNREIIVSMLNKKMDYNTISEITGKTLEEIKEIEDSIRK